MSNKTADPEQAWLEQVEPLDVARNAHRIYDFMRDGGLTAESDIRELAFRKASQALGLDYEVLYQAWLRNRPLALTAPEARA